MGWMGLWIVLAAAPQATTPGGAVALGDLEAARRAVAADPARTPLPPWALASPEGWIELQCPDEAPATPPGPCRRAARNRLALARAESLAAEPQRLSPSQRVAAGESRESVTGQRCRWSRSRYSQSDGEDSRTSGGSVTWTCSEGAGDAAREALERVLAPSGR